VADIKLFGSLDPVVASIGVITQGIGFPLAPVEESSGGSGINIAVSKENVLDSQNFTDQDPPGLGTPLQVIFGGVDASDQWSVDATGAFTCIIAGQYDIRMKLSIGREGSPGVSQIYARVLLNGVPEGSTSHTIVDNGRSEWPSILEFSRTFDAGDVVTVEIVRDTDGHDSGGLRAGVPDVAGWASSPSAQFTIDRTFATELP